MEVEKTEEKIQKLEEKLKECCELYEQLKESYSLNKASIDGQNDESLKQIVDNEIKK